MLPGFLREEREIREKSMELLNAVGLGHLSKEIATGLPYGAQRRLEIARALAEWEPPAYFCLTSQRQA